MKLSDKVADIDQKIVMVSDKLNLMFDSQNKLTEIHNKYRLVENIIVMVSDMLVWCAAPLSPSWTRSCRDLTLRPWAANLTELKPTSWVQTGGHSVMVFVKHYLNRFVDLRNWKSGLRNFVWKNWKKTNKIDNQTILFKHFDMIWFDF